ncbi:hypothetical protein CALCODRAFT_15882 [Calocera cornea HHB12733]|uniref:NB-ARC domain-containing protein n=1 Tax=Calocera cornea HHB12733 TaxID=1353952 RepID=A0A165E8P0_9BASI|nr:hypothetical protein CALCODRAFT_15882 [Calocera cornea HHB12733]
MAEMKNPEKASTKGDSKFRLTNLKRTLNPALGKLADIAIDMLDIRDEFTVNKAECHALAERVAEITESILVRTSASPEMAQMYAPKIKRLQDCLDDISAFLVEQTTPGLVLGLARMAENNRIKAVIAAKDKRLTDVITSLTLDMNMTVVAGTLSDATPFSAVGSTIKSVQVKITIPLTRLPPKPRVYHGREDIVKQIVSSLVQPQAAHVAVLGMGGMGKTSTAAMVLHKDQIMAKYGTKRIFLSCDSITTADGIMTALAAALNLTISNDNDRRAFVYEYIGALHGFVLLVLDNFESAWDTSDRQSVEEMLIELSNISNLSFIVTMRGQQRPIGVDWSQPLLPVLGPFTLEDSRTIYVENGGKIDEHVEELLQELDGWPLAVVLMAYQGQIHPASELLASYKKERTAMLARGPKASHLTSVDVSISLSLNCQTVREVPEAMELLSLLCLLPDGVETKALQDAFPDMPRLQQAERALEQVSLVMRPTEHEIKVLSPIRAFILASKPPRGESFVKLQDYFIKVSANASVVLGGPMKRAYLDSWEKHDNDEKIKLVMKNIGNTLSVFSFAISVSDVSEDLLRAICLLGNFSILTGYGDVSAVMKKAIENSKRITGFTSHWMIEICFTLAKHFCFLRQFSEVDAAMEEAKGLQDDQSFTSRCLLEITTIQLHQVVLAAPNGPDPDSVAKRILQTKRMFEAEEEPWFVAVCLQNLGLLALVTGKFHEAIPLLAESKVLFETEDDRVEVARCTYWNAMAETFQGNFHEAEGMLRSALVVLKDRAIRGLAASAYTGLAHINSAQGKFSYAIKEQIHAEQLLEEIGNPVDIGLSKRTFAHIYFAANRHSEAELKFREAITCFEKSGDKLFCAGTLVQLAVHLEAQGKREDSLKEITASLRLCEDLKNAQAIANCKDLLARMLCTPDHVRKPISPGSNTTVGQEAERLVQEALFVFKAVPRIDPELLWMLGPMPAFRSTPDGPRLFTAVMKKDLAAIWFMSGRLDDETLGEAKEAQAVFTEFVAERRDFTPALADCERVIGCILAERGSKSEGLAHLEKSRSLLQGIPFPGTVDLAKTQEMIRKYEDGDSSRSGSTRWLSKILCCM